MSQIEFYHNLYVSECWQKKKGKIVKRLKENKLQPQVYVITLSQGEQNQLEFFSSVLLKQSIFEHSKLFVIGIADGYDEALFLVEEIVQDVYQETKSANAVRQIWRGCWQVCRSISIRSKTDASIFTYMRKAKPRLN